MKDYSKMANAMDKGISPEQMQALNAMMGAGTGGIENNKGPRLATYISPSQLKEMKKGMLDSPEAAIYLDAVESNPRNYGEGKKKRFWIDDSDARVKNEPPKDFGRINGTSNTLKDTLFHPALMNALGGGTRNAKMSQRTLDGAYGQADPGQGWEPSSIQIDMDKLKSGANQARVGEAGKMLSTIVHEAQHLGQFQSELRGEFKMDPHHVPYNERIQEREAFRTASDILFSGRPHRQLEGEVDEGWELMDKAKRLKLDPKLRKSTKDIAKKMKSFIQPNGDNELASKYSKIFKDIYH